MPELTADIPRLSAVGLAAAFCWLLPAASASSSVFGWRLLPRTMAIRPVRTSSMMPYGRIRSMNASILLSWPEISIITSSAPTSTIRPRKISTSSRISRPLAARRRCDLDQHQVALDVVLRADVVDLDDGDDLFELLADLLQHAVVADDDERHPREVRVFGLADRQAIDVVAARGEHARDVREHARARSARRRKGRDACDYLIQNRNGQSKPAPPTRTRDTPSRFNGHGSPATSKPETPAKVQA